ncbi:hypothetical protein [Burkholderia seminalis]|uniref:hypothetical protein n=1 Tax=Burkholderia seminalis TaxID=488731 RepID=UPI00264FFD8D|nr:hypothetical protein [Burkholderia seminalis]MDN7587742.1 hypothetical protein [Burkholderia seminalis]
METFCGQAAWREMMFFVGVDEKKAGAGAMEVPTLVTLAPAPTRLSGCAEEHPRMSGKAAFESCARRSITFVPTLFVPVVREWRYRVANTASPAHDSRSRQRVRGQLDPLLERREPATIIFVAGPDGKAIGPPDNS